MAKMQWKSKEQIEEEKRKAELEAMKPNVDKRVEELEQTVMLLLMENMMMKGGE